MLTVPRTDAHQRSCWAILNAFATTTSSVDFPLLPVRQRTNRYSPKLNARIMKLLNSLSQAPGLIFGLPGRIHVRFHRNKFARNGWSSWAQNVDLKVVTKFTDEFVLFS